MVPFRKDTLAYFKARPLFQLRDLSEAWLPDAVKALRAYESSLSQKMIFVEPAAVEFYMLNHAFAEVSKRFDLYEPMPAEFSAVAQQYLVTANDLALRMTYYLMLICTREVRHLRPGQYKNNLEKKHGAVFANFQNNIPQSSESAAKYLRTNPPEMKVGEYTKALAHTFHKGNYSSSFGGPKWGVIADVLDNFVHGRISAEVMLDTSWTLAHNTSPIFNKGMLWQHYTSDLVRILDVQRAGMIPQLMSDIASGDLQVANVGPSEVSLWKDLANVLGDPFKGYVNWHRVQELGAVKMYPKELAAQVKKHGPYPGYVAPPEAKPKVAPKPVDPVNKFFISPTEWVEVVKRKKEMA